VITTKASRFIYSSILEASLDPLVTINAEGQITDGNHALMNVTGIQRENLIGQTFPSILQSLTRQSLYSSI
jgi:PAS domain S-box-containing protein